MNAIGIEIGIENWTDAGVDDVGHHHECVHVVLAAVLRFSAGAPVPEPTRVDPAVAVVALPLAWLRKQLPQSCHLRHHQQGLPVALPRDPLPQVRPTSDSYSLLHYITLHLIASLQSNIIKLAVMSII